MLKVNVRIGGGGGGRDGGGGYNRGVRRDYGGSGG